LHSDADRLAAGVVPFAGMHSTLASGGTETSILHVDEVVFQLLFDRHLASAVFDLAFANR